MEVRRVCALDRNSLDLTLRVSAVEDPPDIMYLFAHIVIRLYIVTSTLVWLK
jgi:hypothetical protein